MSNLHRLAEAIDDDWEMYEKVMADVRRHLPANAVDSYDYTQRVEIVAEVVYKNMCEALGIHPVGDAKESERDNFKSNLLRDLLSCPDDDVQDNWGRYIGSHYLVKLMDERENA